ncbi:unnamed protein product, partial [Prorocentrum cordatum]
GLRRRGGPPAPRAARATGRPGREGHGQVAALPGQPARRLGELWVKDADAEPRPFYGWSSELGRWVEWPRDGLKKWWQQPGYLTPNGYRQNPVWNINDYNLCVLETRFAKLEARLTQKLKASGMTIEEIRARSETFEFLESPDRPKVTDKMMYLLQVKALHDGREDELIDLRDGVSAFLKGAAPPQADGSDPVWKDIWGGTAAGENVVWNNKLPGYSRADYERATGKKVKYKKTGSDWYDDYLSKGVDEPADTYRPSYDDKKAER